MVPKGTAAYQHNRRLRYRWVWRDAKRSQALSAAAGLGAPIGRLVPLVIADRATLLVTLTLTMEHLAEECRSAPLLAAVHDVEL